MACANRPDRCCMSSSSTSHAPSVRKLTPRRSLSSWELPSADNGTLDHDICSRPEAPASTSLIMLNL